MTLNIQNDEDPFKEMVYQCRTALQHARYQVVLEKTWDLIESNRDHLEAWLIRAEALAGMDRLADAITAYDRVVDISPRHPLAHVRRGRLLAKMGRHAEAHAAYAHAFGLNRGALTALHGLLNYEHISPDDPALSQLRKGVADDRLRSDHRALGCFLLGRILFNSGRDEEAYAVYALGNRLARESVHTAQTAPVFSRIRPWLDDQEWQKLGDPAQANPACPALVIAGLPRSGKSLVESLLAHHPRIRLGGELGILSQTVRRFSGDETQTAVQTLQSIQNASPRPLHHAYGAAVLKHGASAGGEWITDTLPDNLWHLGYLGWLDPKVPVILCRRNPLDLGVAIYFTQFGAGHHYSYDQNELGATLAAAEHAMALWARILPNPVLLLDYEQMVSSPDQTQSRIEKFLGLSAGSLCSKPVGSHASVTLHPSHSRDDFEIIRSDMVGFGDRFKHHFSDMVSAYEAGMTDPQRLFKPGFHEKTHPL